MVTLAQVAWDDARLDRLLQLSMHEWSALLPLGIDASARYAYAELPLYRDRDARAAFLFVEDGVPIGFGLTSRDADARSHVEEFFVIAGARRRSVGRAAAHALFASQPGPWTFTVRPENPGALVFWRRVCPGADTRIERGDDGIERARFSWPGDRRSTS